MAQSNPKYTIIVSQSYHKDLQDIVHYIAHNLDSPITASEFLDNVEATVSSLSTMPYRYRFVNDDYLSSKNFRRCFVKKYVIFYKICEENKTVMVHRILHARQNWADIL
ncbi:type II toxin-antitoxin system RelE/ParE family toxin [Gardnerella vaginalis]|uniref:type II toxin-antitoxin system RelE/ParE family toxin n=1 Tax=Gardnerella vaginalis TaxID=2702 RepID=UPI0039EFF60D